MMKLTWKPSDVCDLLRYAARDFIIAAELAEREENNRPDMGRAFRDRSDECVTALSCVMQLTSKASQPDDLAAALKEMREAIEYVVSELRRSTEKKIHFNYGYLAALADRLAAAIAAAS